MNLEHVALWWCVRFAGQIRSRMVKGRDGLHCIPTCVSTQVPSESHSYSDGERVLNNDATKKKGQLTDKIFDGIFLGMVGGVDHWNTVWLLGVAN